jgi:hypothetical protein
MENVEAKSIEENWYQKIEMLRFQQSFQLVDEGYRKGSTAKNK